MINKENFPMPEYTNIVPAPLGISVYGCPPLDPGFPGPVNPPDTYPLTPIPLQPFQIKMEVSATELESLRDEISDLKRTQERLRSENKKLKKALKALTEDW